MHVINCIKSIICGQTMHLPVHIYSHKIQIKYLNITHSCIIIKKIIILINYAKYITEYPMINTIYQHDIDRENQNIYRLAKWNLWKHCIIHTSTKVILHHMHHAIQGD